MIATKEDFNALRREEQAVLFVFFDWSGQAVVSLQLFGEWEQEWKASHPNAQVGFYRLDLDKHPETQGWLAAQSRDDQAIEGGFGSVTWLRFGKRVGFVRFAAKAGKDALSRLTNEHFGSPLVA